MDYFNTTYTHKRIGKVEKQMSQRLSFFLLKMIVFSMASIIERLQSHCSLALKACPYY